MKSIAKSGLLVLFSSKTLWRHKIKVVILMKIGQISSMNQQIQQVEHLSASVKTRLYPMNRSCLKRFSPLQCPEQVFFISRLGQPCAKGIIKGFNGFCYKARIRTDWPCGQCSKCHRFTNGTSFPLTVLLRRLSKGHRAYQRAMAEIVFSIYNTPSTTRV